MSGNRAPGAAGAATGGRGILRSATNNQTPATPQAPVSVYSGHECIGRIACRGKLGFEAFDADERPLGIFPNLKRAADAVERAA
jgi:hypothetical protein